MPPRRYDSRLRRQSAQQTRDAILRAALKLHWEGITDFAAIAEEAGCSVPTVRKHFPNKEALFQDCTRRFGEELVLPDLKALAGIPGIPERLEACVSELCRVHEAMFGYAWLGARLQGDSETLDAAMRDYEALADAITAILDPAKPGLVRALLDYLSYRALRLSGGLSEEQARAGLIETVRPHVRGATPVPSSSPNPEAPPS